MNRFTDSFSTYSTITQLIAKWQGGQSGGTVGVGTAYAIGAAPQGLSCNAGGLSLFLPSYAKYILGIRTKFVSGTTHTEFIIFGDNATSQGQLTRNSSGTLSIKRGSTVLGTSALTVALGVSYYVEIIFLCDGSGGQYQVYIDGTLYVTFSGNTRSSANNYSNKLTISAGGGGGNQILYADCYINDDTGSTNTGRQGDTTIIPLKVASPGTYAQFSRGGVDTGSNAGQLNKALADAASFNVDNVLNHRDSFTMDALGTGTILGARLWAHIKKDAVGSRNFALTVESAGTDDIGADQGLGAGGFLWFSRDMSADPNTAAIWATLAALNAAKVGYKITL